MKRNFLIIILLFCLFAVVSSVSSCEKEQAGNNVAPAPDDGGSKGEVMTESVSRVAELCAPKYVWKAKYDRENVGVTNKWYNTPSLAGSFTTDVPGNLYMMPDGLQRGVWWYQCKFTPDIETGDGMSYFVSFEGVDYYVDVYLNGTFIGSHEGQEVGFSFDATDAFLPDAENVLTVRLISPGDYADEVQGMVLWQVPFGQAYGGIQAPVSISSAGTVAIRDVYAVSDVNTGEIKLSVSLANHSAKTEDTELSVSVTKHGDNRILYSGSTRISCVTGEQTSEISVKLTDYELWDLDNPNLYNVSVTASVSDAPSRQARTDTYSLRTGFRTFEVRDGYFFLNGERLILKCAHSCNSTPEYRSSYKEYGMLREDVAMAKTAGFNCMRVIKTPANKAQLELCDELGMLVIQGHPAEWLLEASAYVEERFERSVTQRVLSDRNHPSVIAWELLNETYSTDPVYKCAKAFLVKLRELDNTRLVMLSSGRFDRDFSVGSVSNPGSDVWEAVWGAEGTDTKAVTKYAFSPEYYAGAGDAHLYPREVSASEMYELFAGIGNGTKPVFVSESGFASSWNAIVSARYSENNVLDSMSPTNQFAFTQEKILASFIEKYELEDVFPVNEDYYTQSSLKQARRRELLFSYVRRNPKIAGLSFTSLTDGGFVGEGFVGLIREPKAGNYEAVVEGWAELRWCLFADPMTVYSDEPLTLEATLASEDALKPGKYNVTLKIFGDNGIVWTKKCQFEIKNPAAGEYMPLAFEVFRGTVNVPDLKEGEYTFAAVLENGGYAYADRITFDVIEREKTVSVSGMTLRTVGSVPNDVKKYLTEQGVKLSALDFSEPISDGEVILVGTKVAAMPVSDWALLYKRIASGAHAVFLSADGFTKITSSIDYVVNQTVRYDAEHLLFENTAGAVYEKRCDNVYHKEPVGKPSALTQGLKNKGILDFEYYDDIIEGIYITADVIPDETAILAFGVGIEVNSNKKIEGIMLGSFDFYAGSFTVNTLNISGNIGHPVADRLLNNILSFAASKAVPAEAVSERTEKYINSYFG